MAKKITQKQIHPQKVQNKEQQLPITNTPETKQVSAFRPESSNLPSDPIVGETKVAANKSNVIEYSTLEKLQRFLKNSLNININNETLSQIIDLTQKQNDEERFIRAVDNLIKSNFGTRPGYSFNSLTKKKVLYQRLLKEVFEQGKKGELKLPQEEVSKTSPIRVKQETTPENKTKKTESAFKEASLIEISQREKEMLDKLSYEDADEMIDLLLHIAERSFAKKEDQLFRDLESSLRIHGRITSTSKEELKLIENIAQKVTKYTTKKRAVKSEVDDLIKHYRGHLLSDEARKAGINLSKAAEEVTLKILRINPKTQKDLEKGVDKVLKRDWKLPGTTITTKFIPKEESSQKTLKKLLNKKFTETLNHHKIKPLFDRITELNKAFDTIDSNDIENRDKISEEGMALRKAIKEEIGDLSSIPKEKEKEREDNVNKVYSHVFENYLLMQNQKIASTITELREAINSGTQTERLKQMKQEAVQILSDNILGNAVDSKIERTKVNPDIVSGHIAKIFDALKS